MACLFASGCATLPPTPYTENGASLASLAPVEDQRGRFREVFCAVLEEQGQTLPDSRPCEDALTRYGVELGATDRSVELGQSARGLVAVFVPGIGWSCIAEWLDLEATIRTHVRRNGFDLVEIPVGAMSSTVSNACQVRDAIIQMDPVSTGNRLVLIGYSKGVPDILEAIVSFPEILPRIAAIVSVAGAIGGSPLAEDVRQSQLELLEHWPDAQCSAGDGGAIESLRPAVRSAWLEEHTLPESVPIYSLLTCPDPDRISSALRSSYRKLSRLDPRNDGMVLLEDQLIPGSTVIGCLNADHWAVAVPIKRSHPNVGSLMVEHNDYPREALLEAVLRFVEEDLSASTMD